MWKKGLPQTREKSKNNSVKRKGWVLIAVSFSINNDIAALLRILET